MRATEGVETQATVKYYRARRAELQASYASDIQYFADLARKGVEQLDGTFVLTECAWVAYATNFSAAILDRKWAAIKHAFHNFNIDAILNDQQGSLDRVLRVFRNTSKASSVVHNALRIRHFEQSYGSVGAYFKTLQSNGIQALEPALQGRRGGFKGIGPDNVRQLIRNLGLGSLEKPDRHLIEIAAKFGRSVTDLVGTIAEATGEPRGVIDYVLWLSSARPPPPPGLTMRKHDC